MIKVEVVYAKSPGLIPDCFGKIKLLSKKYLNIYNFIKNLAVDWKKRNSAIVFEVFLLPFFNVVTMFPFLQSYGNIPDLSKF